MLHYRDYEKLSQFELGSMERNRNRPVSIYASANPELTGQYFGKDSDHSPIQFELVVFSYKYGMGQVYVKLPGLDYYIELLGGTGSSRGTMTAATLRNVYKEILAPFVYEDKIQPEIMKLFHHETHALLTLGSEYEHNFMVSVAQLIKNGDAHITQSSEDHINSMLASKVLYLPNHRSIDYCYETVDGNIVLVDSSMYNSTYESMRCFYGNFSSGIKEGAIKKFCRYRDGGTTTFTLEINGESHEFFSPSPLKRGTPKPTLDNKPMTQVSQGVIDVICHNLKIQVGHQVARK